jgi:hypothetical protein
MTVPLPRLAPRLVERQRLPCAELVEVVCTSIKDLSRFAVVERCGRVAAQSPAYSATVILFSRSTVAAVKLAGLNLGDLVLGVHVPV